LLGLIEFAGKQNEQNYIDLFLSLPANLYRGDKNHRAEDTAEVKAWLKGEHPCKSFLVQKNLLVTDGLVPVARGIAFVNGPGGFGSIGFFECEDDAGAVSMLVGAAKAFCREHRVSKIYAPMNGSIWGSYRLMTKGFEDYPFLGEPHNKRYYKAILEGCGFSAAKTWETQFIEKISAKGQTADRFQQLEKLQKQKGIKVRSLENFDADFKTIHKIAMNAFSNFFAFHEIDEGTFCGLYSGLKRLCDRRTVKIAFDQDGVPVGFGIALPDYRSKWGFLFKYAKRYIFLYLGTQQRGGESVYPQAGKAIVTPIMKNLYIRRKGCICALLGEGAKTRNFAPSCDKNERTHEYALMELDMKLEGRGDDDA